LSESDDEKEKRKKRRSVVLKSPSFVEDENESCPESE